MKRMIQRFGLTKSASSAHLKDGTESAKSNDWADAPSYHALKDHLRRRGMDSQYNASTNHEPGVSDADEMQSPKRSSVESTIIVGASLRSMSRSASVVSGVDHVESHFNFMPSSIDNEQGRRPSRPLPAVLDSTLLPEVGESRAVAMLPEAVDSPPGRKMKGSQKAKPLSRRATMDPEQMKAVRERMRHALRDERLEALKMQGKITEFVLQDEATIRSLGLNRYELVERAMAANATEKEVNVAVADPFDPTAVLIKLIVKKELEKTPSLEEQAKEHKANVRDRFRKSKTAGDFGCILSPESLGFMDNEKQVAAKRKAEEAALPCGFQKGDVVTTLGGNDENGPWKDSGGVGVILGLSIGSHVGGCVDVLFDRTGDIFKVKAKNLRRYDHYHNDDESSTGKRRDPKDTLLPALRGREFGAAPNGFIKGVSIFDPSPQKLAFDY